jgi:hypothetical protein
MATNEETTTDQTSAPRILSDEQDTRYIELSTQCEQDAYWHPSATITLAAFSDDRILLHRMKSEETAIRFDLSQQEMQALITGYTAYVVARESASRPSDENPFDPLSDLDDHPF